MAKDTSSTQPKLTTEGVSTRGTIQQDMGNNPKGTAFRPVFYSGAKQPEPTSPGRSGKK